MINEIKFSGKNVIYCTSYLLMDRIDNGFTRPTISLEWFMGEDRARFMLQLAIGSR